MSERALGSGGLAVRGQVKDQKELPTVRTMAHQKILLCGGGQQTGRGLENRASPLLETGQGRISVYLKFSHKNKLGEINRTSTFDQMYVERIRLCTTFIQYIY